MGFWKKTVNDIDIDNKRVLLRVDYNVPMDESGDITDDYRLQKSLPTIEYLLEHGCSLVLASHLGRPDGKVDLAFSLEPVAKRLSKLLGKEVIFLKSCVGEAVSKATADAKPGQIFMLENVRFYKEEEINDEEFGKRLAEDSHAEVFVQDCFGVVHRAHASIVAVTHYLPSVAGLLVENEVTTILGVMDNPQRPLMAIIGGAKISDKIDALNRFIDIADFVAVGGAMANTFLLAQGFKIGKSVAEPKEIATAKKILKRAEAKIKEQNFIFYLPQDGVVATSLDRTAQTRIVDWDAHVIAAIENYPRQAPRRTEHVLADELILDIGPFSGAFIAGGMQLAKTVIWNGAMGVTETKALHGPVGPFAHGTELVVDAMLGEYGHKPFTVLGGGDTVSYIEDRKLTDCFDHVSTGGGASMELMSGKSLPGVDALMDKDG
ncbi:MAG: phosphoglycerate kinase [Patescibacteria group bacterium]